MSAPGVVRRLSGMTWQQTHRRWQIQRDVDQAVDNVGAGDPQVPLGALAWREEYGDAFADVGELHRFLRYRWNLRLEAQLDPYLTDAALDERFARLAGVRAGLAALEVAALGGVTDPRDTEDPRAVA